MNLKKFVDNKKDKKRNFLTKLMNTGKTMADKSKNQMINEEIKKRANY